MTTNTTTDAGTSSKTAGWTEFKPTALLVLADGTVIEGKGLGATGICEAEVCFNTALTGYEEILTDPSYARPDRYLHLSSYRQCRHQQGRHRGSDAGQSRSVRLAQSSRPTLPPPSSYRAADHLDHWLKARGVIALAGVDTRALTVLIREKGMPNAVIAHDPDGTFDIPALKKRAAAWHGLLDLDLAKDVTSGQSSVWTEKPWVWNEGFDEQTAPEFHVVAIDYGIKRNILRLIAGLGAKVTILPASATAEDVLAHKPDGIFLSNGPGDPAATGKYAVPAIKELIKTDIPVFGICLGHQMLALALGGDTKKMHQGHHGANHPVRDDTTGKVEIVSMNHGFAVDAESFPDGVEETHISLFDGSNCGLRVVGRPVFSVQHHPEASPGPQDSHYLFRRFFNLIRESKGMETLPERDHAA